MAISSTHCVNFQERDVNLKDNESRAWFAEDISTFLSEGILTGYEIGRFLTTPWSWGIAKIIQAFNGGSLIQKINCIGIGLILAITGPFALVGLIMRLALFSFRNPFELTTTALMYPPPEMTGKVFTWNVALGPRFQAAALQLSFPEKRVEAIVSRIIGQNPDFVCLQEVYDHDAREALSNQLAGRGYDCIGAFNPIGIGLDSGLFIAVKHSTHLKVLKVASWEFDNLVEDDIFSKKGVAAVKLQCDGRIINLFNTHLQASYSRPKGYAVERGQQIASLVGRVKEWTKEDENPQNILCGDLNYGKVPLEAVDSFTEYDTQAANFGGTFVDGNTKPAGLSSLGSFIKPDGTGDSVVDYILSNDNSIKNYQILPTTRDESDHRPLVASYGA